MNSDTFNNFITLITEDPIMLGLCIAIGVLVVVFIIVLCSGGKKKEAVNKEESTNIENTSELLQSDIDDAILKSTQEYSVPNLMADVTEKTVEMPPIEEVVRVEEEKEAPISIEEAMELKETREEELEKQTIQVPIIEEEEPVKVEVPSEPVNVVNTEAVFDFKPIEEVKEEIKPVETASADDDLDLPKLNTSNENSVLNALEGESFNIYR